LPELKYQKARIHARATIVSKSIVRASSSGSNANYRIDYRFSVRPGKSFEGTDTVEADQWEGLKAGDPFDIVYLPASPQINRSVTKTEMPPALGFASVPQWV
jgi:hypothetical protein